MKLPRWLRRRRRFREGGIVPGGRGVEVHVHVRGGEQVLASAQVAEEIRRQIRIHGGVREAFGS